ncbi:MAG: phosphoribosylformylglycinamidine cyclo-ligase [Thermoanaerobaculia bacterium]|nr:phosphoribosylformylglycinamidine cyclo-ligase [Thermoanaerobaculia bacterium]
MSKEQQSAYRDAGVDIDAQDEALHRVKDLVRATTTPGVLSELGSFGGLFRPSFEGLEEPVLVSSADGVGTKLRVAGLVGDYSTVGRDLVNHCVNDILVQGAEPLLFLDYVGAGVLESGSVVQLVEGVSSACRENGCALLGGETAEMPGFYQPGDYELVGFVVGLVDRPKILDGSKVSVGDVLVGLPSSGLHTNGYSLARHVLFERQGLTVDDPIPDVEPRRTVGEWLLDVHKSYLRAVRPLLGRDELRALAHITGGGLVDNLPRSLPAGCRAVVHTDSWEVPEPFRAIERLGGIERQEMFRVFNMGVGMALVVRREGLETVLAELRDHGEEPFVFGEVVAGDRGVELSGEGAEGS